MKTRILCSLIFLALTISACSPGVTPPSDMTEAPTKEATPLPTPTAAPRSLTICLGNEPTTLYPYGDLSSAARSVLSAVYDGPMDVRNYSYDPVILDKVPNLTDGDAQVSSVTVSQGDQVVDTTGNVVALDTGVKVRPKDCRSDGCAITYDGSSQIQMDQMVVTFTMLKDLLWSDGEPLTAEDSVYAFTLASDNSTPTNKFLIDRTQTYEAAEDGVTVQWWGVPGFIDPDYYTNFWMPLPKHKWEQYSATDLLKMDISTRSPLGWGPYIIQDWETGKSIHLVKNLNYFRAASGLPKFDDLTFLFTPNENSAIAALADGTCDVLDPSIRLDGQVGLLQQMQQQGQAKLLTAPSSTIEWLGLGIVPASYDNGYNSTGTNPDRPDFFGDVRMRQAIALCLDRQKVVDTVLFGLTKVPDSYIPFGNPLHNGNIQTYTFNPTAGNKLLEQIGWVDYDNDPSTPRVSLGVSRVPNGTPLVLEYDTTSATQRRQVAEIFTDSLAQCGIGLNVKYDNASDFYASGPTGPLFGRHFDLAEYAIGVNSLEPQCGWFTTSQIPSEENNWVGTNISGYKNPNFDTACQQGLQSLPSDPTYTSHQEAQATFANDIPSIPLYLRLKVAASRPDICGFTLDSSSPTALQDLEAFDYGDGCK